MHLMNKKILHTLIWGSCQLYMHIKDVAMTVCSVRHDIVSPQTQSSRTNDVHSVTKVTIVNSYKTNGMSLV